jgi:osmotically-inducible protein OsmY
MTRTDAHLKQDVDLELAWDPKLNAAQIGVSVDQGAVSLLGTVDTYAEKWAAEDAAKRVSGVRTLAQDLTVKVLADHARSDSDLAVAVQHTLKWDVLVPKTVTATVCASTVTLEGQVDWNFEREAASRAIRHLKGIVAVKNTITLKPRGASATEITEKLEAALQRQATTDAKSIHVVASGGKVTLTGHASSWQAIEDAAHAAWAGHGVTQVIDQVKLQMTI